MTSAADARGETPFRLAEAAHSGGYRFLLYDDLGSTNDEAIRLARAGDRGRAWILAKAQHNGRGRRGRHWASPLGNLYASLLLVDEMPLRLAPQLGFVAGVALARALRECIGDDTRLRLKWPNDILFDGAKLAGILLESVAAPGGSSACIVGIGVNCASCPSDLAYRATALTQIGATQAMAQDVFLHLSEALPYWLEIFAGGAGFETIREEWLGLAAGLNEPIRIDMPNGSIAGVFRGIDAQGRLMLACADGARLIEAGDVWFQEHVAAKVTGFSDDTMPGDEN